jgi:hypothetical protein
MSSAFFTLFKLVLVFCWLIYASETSSCDLTAALVAELTWLAARLMEDSALALADLKTAKLALTSFTFFVAFRMAIAAAAWSASAWLRV